MNERLLVALKCSLALSLAVLFGVLFNKKNGLWSGLTVAITITPLREATFKKANSRAQGTALGSVYGVLGSVISQKLMEVRFLVLLPWIIFTSFLRHSQMYGNTGGIAAIITAMIIMGRRIHGAPTAFAIVRLTETFIGLSCSICVELLLQPTRAATLARIQLSKILQALNQRLELMDLWGHEVQLTNNEELQLRHQLDELMKYIGEADEEPNFWFLPFHTTCYKKLHCSLSKILNLEVFLVHAMELLVKEFHILVVSRDVNKESIYGDLEHFKKLVGSSLRWFEEVIQVRSLGRLQKELKMRTISTNLELGNPKALDEHEAMRVEEEEHDQVVASFLRHAQCMVRLDADVCGDQLVFYLVVIAFCMDGFMRETRELEMGILELVYWEDPTNHIN